MWRLCWSEDGSPIYASEARSERDRCGDQTPKEVTWPELPIRVRIDENLDSVQNEVRAALWTWNHWAGRPLFEESLFGSDVRVSLLQCIRPGVLAMAPHLTESGRLGAAVLVCPSTIVESPEDQIQILTHEFGHVLGFAHDPLVETSIMYPYARPGQRGHLTDADMRALLRVYGRRAR